MLSNSNESLNFKFGCLVSILYYFNMMKFANAFETESFVIKEELHTYHSKLPQKGNLGIYDVVSQLDLVGTQTIVQVINFVRF